MSGGKNIEDKKDLIALSEDPNMPEDDKALLSEYISK
jgi:hypothetical protein